MPSGEPKKTSIPIIGHVEWERRFTVAIEKYRSGDDGTVVRGEAVAEMRELGLSDGDIVYYTRKKIVRV